MADFFVSMKDEALSYQGVTRLRGVVGTPRICGVPSITIAIDNAIRVVGTPRICGVPSITYCPGICRKGLGTPQLCGGQL